MLHGPRRFTIPKAALAILGIVYFPLPACAQTEIHAGIEIGSNSIKYIVVEVTDKQSAKRLSKEDAKGVKIYPSEEKYSIVEQREKVIGRLAYKESAIAELSERVQAVMGKLQRELKLDPSRIHVAVSSGVQGAVTDEGKSMTALKAALLKRGVVDVEMISAEQEARYPLIQLRRQLGEQRVDLSQTLLIDIGSGNIKWGYLSAEGGTWKSSTGEVAMGTRVFAGALENLAQQKGIAAANRVQAMLQAAEPLRVELRMKINQGQEKTKEFRNRRGTVYFIGGTPFILASITHPQDYKKDAVVLTAEDVKRYLAIAGKGEFDKAPLGLDADGLKAYARATKTFRSDNIVAGHVLLDEVYREFALRDPGIRVVFPRDSLYLWIQRHVEARAGIPEPAAPKSISQVPGVDLKTLQDQLNALALENKRLIAENRQLKQAPRPAATADPTQPAASVSDFAKELKSLHEKLPAKPVQQSDIQQLIDAIRSLERRLESGGKIGAAVDDPEAADRLFQAGRERIKKSNYKEAASFFASAVKSQNDNAAMWYGLGIAQIATGDADSARVSAGKVARLTAHAGNWAAEIAPQFESVQGSLRYRIDQLVIDARERRAP
jgi:hypothetical protein